MTTPRDNLTPDPAHASLDVVESGRSALGSLAALQRDRAALRDALAVDQAQPLTNAQSVALRAAVAAAMQDTLRGELDVGALAALGDGAALPPDPARRVVHAARPSVLATVGPWLFSRSSLVAAAAVAIVAGAFYLASMSPGARVPASSPLAKSPRDPGLPSWAVLPDRPATPVRVVPAPAASVDQEPAKLAVVTKTTDAALALTWLREGRLAIRLTTDAPRRDSAKLATMLAEANPASVWSLGATDGRDAAVPAKPWPIDTRMADADGRATMPRRENARLGAFNLAVRPTADALAVAKESLERATRGGVVFERVDALASDGLHLEDAAPSAARLLWWTKSAEHWSRRVRVPMVVEFGSPSAR